MTKTMPYQPTMKLNPHRKGNPKTWRLEEVQGHHRAASPGLRQKENREGQDSNGQ
ncbi:hypothetical protein [Paenarthrobacter sp. FR1]|uniref:hypothetical protein n=1 Tax=Paenarthrobacter sp. FR1 TaxID=3439548 RepID=UPI003DA1D76D